MVYITQLIYIKQGAENVFHQFEDIAIPIILKYSGSWSGSTCKLCETLEL